MHNNLLTTALRANAGFSFITGTASVVASQSLSERLGIAEWLLVGLGIGLVGFSLLVGYVAITSRTDRAKEIIVADVAWVIGAAVLLIGRPDLMSIAGRWTLLIVTVVVADLAATQWIGLRKLTQA